MSTLWSIVRDDDTTTRVLVMRDDAGHWFHKEKPRQQWQDLEEPHDVEVYEALRTLGLA